MSNAYRITRKFSRIYGAAGVWAVAGGGILTLTTGQILFGSLLIAGAVVLGYLVATGRLLRERQYTATDIFFLFLPTVGVTLIVGVYFLIFPWSYLLLPFLAVFIGLSVLAAIELRSSSGRIT